MPVVHFAGDDVVCGFKLFSFLHLLCVQSREAQSNQPSLSPLDHRPKAGRGTHRNPHRGPLLPKWGVLPTIRGGKSGTTFGGCSPLAGREIDGGAHFSNQSNHFVFFFF
ncbi:hypothetical protein HanIR_Chr03g0114831 [Helianthus annuus]|nr:hypothetical protein HanIR_Chr03g0114831 [Helianthus annuus]